jgi:hypothetical protein
LASVRDCYDDPIVGVSRRRPLLVRLARMTPTPGVPVTNLAAGARAHPTDRTLPGRGADQGALVVVGGLVGSWGVAG